MIPEVLMPKEKPPAGEPWLLGLSWAVSLAAVIVGAGSTCGLAERTRRIEELELSRASLAGDLAEARGQVTALEESQKAAEGTLSAAREYIEVLRGAMRDTVASAEQFFYLDTEFHKRWCASRPPKNKVDAWSVRKRGAIVDWFRSIGGAL